MTIAFIHSFHDVLPMCSVFQTCQTVAASSKSVTPVETSYLPLIIRNTLLVYDVIFIVGPERLGPKRLDVGSPWYLTRVYWTLYPWYIEPSTHGILNHLPMVYWIGVYRSNGAPMHHNIFFYDPRIDTCPRNDSDPILYFILTSASKSELSTSEVAN